MAEQVNTELTVAELLEAIEKDPSRVEPSTKKRSALEAIKAVQAVAGAITKHAEYLLAVILPMVFEFLAIAKTLSKQQLEQDSDDVPKNTWAQIVGRFEAAIAKLINNSSFAILRATHLATIRFRIKRDVGEQEATDILVWAVQNKYLSETFKVTAEGFGLKPEDKEEIAHLVGALRGKQLKAVNAQKADRKATIPPPSAPVMGPISAREAWDGKVGKFELLVPANGDKGGALQLECQVGERIFVVKASNGYSDLENADILLSAIKGDNGSIRNGLKLIPPPMLSGEKLDKWKWHMERLGKVLQRGFNTVIVDEKRELEEKDFLLGAVGTAVLTYEGPFSWAPPNHPEARVTINDLTLRFVRRNDQMISLDGIISQEDDAVDLFGEALGDFYEPGNSFLKIRPRQCSMFLRAVYRQVVVGDRK